MNIRYLPAFKTGETYIVLSFDNEELMHVYMLNTSNEYLIIVDNTVYHVDTLTGVYGFILDNVIKYEHPTLFIKNDIGLNGMLTINYVDGSTTLVGIDEELLVTSLRNNVVKEIVLSLYNPYNGTVIISMKTNAIIAVYVNKVFYKVSLLIDREFLGVDLTILLTNKGDLVIIRK